VNVESSKRWFAVQVQPRKEQLVGSLLALKGHEHFLPLRNRETHTVSRWTNRKPLFPGYLFCRLDTGALETRIVTTPGVVRLVGFGAAPDPIPDYEIESLRIVTETSALWQVEPRLQHGAAVQISTGPLSGVQGRFIHARGKDRVVVQVEILNGGVSVEVKLSQVTLLERADEGHNTSSGSVIHSSRIVVTDRPGAQISRSPAAAQRLIRESPKRSYG
jgi:transcription antitermination factor NusG